MPGKTKKPVFGLGKQVNGIEKQFANFALNCPFDRVLLNACDPVCMLVTRRGFLMPANESGA